MQDIKEFYILGLPIDTPIGPCHFLKVGDYPDMCHKLNILSLTHDHITQGYQKAEQFEQSILEFLQQISLFEVIHSSLDLKEEYIKLFNYVFQKDEAFSLISKENFDYYRSLIMRMNCIKEEKVNPNPEIQEWIEKSRRVRQGTGDDKLEFADIVSSIVGFNGLDYKAINEMTIYQLYMTFHRIAQIKGYDTSTLFATVSSDKVDIQSWCKHIDLFSEEQHGISREDYNNKKQNVFGNG